ncbi:MAG: hypothetical protein U0441_13780 [Polyangiaceae bacterium]
MRRSGAAMAVALILTAAGLLGGCWDTGPVYLPTGALCDAYTGDESAVCEGGICLLLNPNKQNMLGICSADCASDDNCTPREHCVSIQGQTSYCMRGCLSDTDCFDDFVCRLPNPGAPYRICLVDPA